MSEIPAISGREHGLKAVWLKPEEYPEWDSFVESHPLGLIYHTSAWAKAIESTFEHIRGNFLALRSGRNERIIGGIPAYTVRSWLLGNRIVSIPYASICDLLVSSAQHLEVLWPSLVNLEESTSSSYLEFRTVRTTDSVNTIPFCFQKEFLHHYLKLDQPIEDLKKRLPYNLRREINQSHKNGLRLNIDKGEASIDFLCNLINDSRKKLCLPPIPLKFFESIHCRLNDKISILFAERSHKKVASLLILHSKNTLHIEYYGGIPQAYLIGASHFLHWEAIRYAHENGYETISFGRTHPQNDGLIAFKRRWNTIGEPISVSRIYLKNQTGKSLEKGRNSIVARALFGRTPLFIRKAIASFIYRHHG